MNGNGFVPVSRQLRLQILSSSGSAETSGGVESLVAGRPRKAGTEVDRCWAAFPEELKKAAATDSLLKGLLESPRMQDGIHEFSALLSPDMQAAVLRGAASLPKFEVSQLDARGKQFVHDVWKNAQPDGAIGNHLRNRPGSSFERTQAPQQFACTLISKTREAMHISEAGPWI